MEPGGHREMVDERFRGERGTHVRRRGRRVPKPDHVRRRVRAHVVGLETVERHDDDHRMFRGGAQQRASDGNRDDRQRIAVTAGHGRFARFAAVGR